VKIFLTDGKGDERPFVSRILSPGQTGVMDRYYQRGSRLKALETKSVDVRPLISKVFAIAEGIEAFQYAARKGVLKVLLRIG